ncbi:hypothetical protein AVEN_260152-1, partial [Araneus ventricosus]
MKWHGSLTLPVIALLRLPLSTKGVRATRGQVSRVYPASRTHHQWDHKRIMGHGIIIINSNQSSGNASTRFAPNTAFAHNH